MLKGTKKKLKLMVSSIIKSERKLLTGAQKYNHIIVTSDFGQGHNYSLKTKYNFSPFVIKGLLLHLKNKFSLSKPPPYIKNKRVNSAFV